MRKESTAFTNLLQPFLLFKLKNSLSQMSHLICQSIWGYRFNAVKTQIYIAMITYRMIAIVKHQLKLNHSQYKILQILSISLLCKTPLLELFSNDYPQYVKEHNSNQLNIFEL